MNNRKKRAGRKSRFEFRVWPHNEGVGERLALMAETDRRQRLEDCYLVVPDLACNVKIRGTRMKVKRLMEERIGFERWSSIWPRVEAHVPEPLKKIHDELGLIEHNRTKGDHDAVAVRGEVRRIVGRLAPRHDVRAHFVTKHRRRFHFGSIRAETSVVEVEGRPGRWRTVAIEGPDLDDLVRLRHSLGLTHLPNVALHLALATDLN